MRFILSFFLLISFSIHSLFAEESVYKIQSTQDIVNLFPKTAEEMLRFKELSIKEGNQKLEDIKTCILTQQHRDIILKKFDELLLYLKTKESVAEALTLVSPDPALRAEAQEAQLAVQEKSNHIFVEETPIYHFFTTCLKAQEFSESYKNFISEIIYKFETNGQNLAPSQREQVQSLKNNIAKLEQCFSKNIQEDNRSITLKKEDLKGVSEDLLRQLSTNEEGFITISCNFPSFSNVLSNCDSQTTRKRLIELGQNRGFPLNEAVLKELIKKRQELSEILGFKSFAHLRLQNEMCGSPEKASAFLDELWQRSFSKASAEFESIVQALPPHISLNENGKLESWDTAYSTNFYKKKTFSINQDEIAQYFPFDHTFDQLMDIYEQFFDIRLKRVPISGLWHQDVQMLEVSEKNATILGYILLDLFPRENKFSHACDAPLIAGALIEGKKYPALDLVIANFPKESQGKPSLLKHHDVETFFHEFGHAIHDILIQNEVLYFANLFQMKYDFVELPSQLLEEWLWEPAILKKVSSHYLTQQPLPDSAIEEMLKIKNASSGYFIQSQCRFSKLALELFSNTHQEPEDLLCNLTLKFTPNYEPYKNDHFYLSFGHLTDYGPAYYGYLWSKVFALDIFDKIKKEGLLNPAIGVRYRKEILEKGTSVDPNRLIENFLGRKPSQEAFIKSLEL